MPAWIHDRARHLLAKNPDMPKSEAFAVATQQSHALGKSPKGYGTSEGRATAKAKFDTPKDDKKTANPGNLETPKLAGMRIDYDANFNPVRAQTHDEWLVSVFKRDGSFHVPAMLDHVPAISKHGMEAFVDELGKIAFATNQFSGPMNPDIRSGASDLPPFRQPSLARGIQKSSGSITPNVGPERGDLAKVGEDEKTFSERNPNGSQYLKATGAGLGLTAANAGLGHLTMSQLSKERAGDQALADGLVRDAPVPVIRPEGPVVGGAHFSPGSHLPFSAAAGGPAAPHVKVPVDMKNPAAVAHELGHADLHLNRFGRMIQNTPSMLAGGPGAAVAAGAGGFASGFSDDKDVRRAGLLAPAVLSAPTLAYEAGASINGLRRLRRGGASLGQLANAGKALLPAWGTYGTRAAANVASAAGSQAIGSAIHDKMKRDREKSAGLLGDALGAAKKALTTPIPGTPELFPHAALETATRFGKPAAKAAPTPLIAASQDWRAARAAAYRPATGTKTSAVPPLEELWPDFAKTAAPATEGVNIGQWWEQVGGPHLAKGGSHEDFKKLMDQHGLPEAVQKKFMGIAQQKYPAGYNMGSGAKHEAARAARGAGPMPAAGEAARAATMGPAGIAANVGGLGAALGIGAYALRSPKTQDPEEGYAPWKGRVGAHLSSTLPFAYLGQEVPRMFGGGAKARTIGALAAGTYGGLLGEAALRAGENRSVLSGRRAAKTERGQERITEEAGVTASGHTRKNLLPAMAPMVAYPLISRALYGNMGQHRSLGTDLGVGAGTALGTGMLQKHLAQKSYDTMKETRDAPKALDKAAAGAPTRGNFMMASDLPAFQPPRLDRGIQKNSGETSMPVGSGASQNPLLENSGKAAAGMPDGITANSNDFKPAKLAMSTEEMAVFVERLRKQADVSPAAPWNGGTFGGTGARGGVSDIPPFRAPRLDRAIQKEGEAGITPLGRLNSAMSVGAPKATAPPGPSIADIAKPKGAKFGIGIPGAFKTKI